MQNSNWEVTDRRLLLGEVSMRESHMITNCGEAFLQSFGDRNRPMAPAGTANSDIEITTPFALEERNEQFKELLQLIEKGLRLRIVQYITQNTGIFPSQRLEVWNEEGVAQESYIEQHIDIVGNAKLVPESDQRNGELAISSFLT